MMENLKSHGTQNKAFEHEQNGHFEDKDRNPEGSQKNRSESELNLVPVAEQINGTVSNPKENSQERKSRGCACKFSWKFYNIIIVSIGFMLVFSGFFPATMILAAAIEGIKLEDPSYKGDAFTSLAILYFTFAIFGWISPSILSALKYKLSMTIAGLGYALFSFSSLYPVAWFLYLCSVICGAGSSLMWTSNGMCITCNSNDRTLGRNTGLFWVFYIFSAIAGNIFVSNQFTNTHVIEADLRNRVFAVLGSVSTVGALLMTLLKLNKQTMGVDFDETTDTKTPCCSPSALKTAMSRSLNAFISAIKLFPTKKMLLLSFACFYTGFTLAFFSAVFSASVGFIGYFGSDAKSLIGEAGIGIGAGSMVAGATISLLGKRANQVGKDTLIVIIYFFQVLTFYLIFLSFPDDATFGLTFSPTYVNPHKAIVIFCGFWLGAGDATFNVMIYSVISELFPDTVGPAHGLYRFLQALASGISFMYSGQLLLKWQLLIMVLTVSIGSIGFFVADGISFREKKGREKPKSTAL